MDYRKYTLSFKEHSINLAISLLLISIKSYLFYHSFMAFPFLCPLVIPVYKIRTEYLHKKQLYILNIQFKDCISSMSSSLAAGYSIENSLTEALREMNVLHGKKSLITQELSGMIRQTELKIPIEKVFEEFSARTGLEDILLFSSVFQIANKSGGDLIRIMKSTAAGINQKTEVLKEINTILSAKKYEQSIMNLIPMFIIVYISYTSPELMKPLYGNLMGAAIMSACLLLYGFSYFISGKIVNIEV